MIVGGGIGGLFAANALIAQGLRVSVYEQAPALGEIRGRCVPDAEQRAPSAEDRIGTGGGKVGSQGGRGLSLLPPRRRADRPGAGPSDSAGWNATFGMHRADLVEMLAKALPARTRARRTPVYGL